MPGRYAWIRQRPASSRNPQASSARSGAPDLAESVRPRRSTPPFLLQQMFQRVPAQSGRTVTHHMDPARSNYPFRDSTPNIPGNHRIRLFTISSRLYSFPSEISAIVTLRSISTSLFLPQSDLKSPTNVPDPPLVAQLVAKRTTV